MTSALIDAPLFRVDIMPSRSNCLEKPSAVMCDKVLTVPGMRVEGKAFGALSAADLDRVDTGLRFWLDL